ncbi:MAG: hypothetical protein OER59_06060 [Desulfobulbaceae bacterium]|nr:hypothetical protein [Desulfobulbaceae bacterium]PLX52821.1 MAG: hypothetical protein C0612_00880 [Desulfobulbaceae bacterium]
MDLGNITLVARWVGIGLIVLTWIQVIPLTLGWVGFGMAAISFVLETIYKKNLPPSSKGGNPG